MASATRSRDTTLAKVQGIWRERSCFRSESNSGPRGWRAAVRAAQVGSRPTPVRGYGCLQHRVSVHAINVAQPPSLAATTSRLDVVRTRILADDGGDQLQERADHA